MLTSLLLQIAVATGPMPAVRFELPNGLRVWVQEEPSRPVALVQITYKVGSLHEGPGTTGIAHFVEHMVYRASENIRNEDAYGYIDRIGGRYTGGTWPHMTQYAETVPSWALESALRVTAERMGRALFDSLEFERERSNVVTEANGFSDQDAASAFRDDMMYASFEEHPYRLNSNTWARDNLVLTRADAFAWYKRYYGPNNAVLVIVGDVDAREARRLVEKHFSTLARAPGSPELRVVETSQRAEKRVYARHAGSANHLEILYRAPASTDKDYPAFAVMSRLLGLWLNNALDSSRITDSVSVRDTATAYPYVLRIAGETDSPETLARFLMLVQAGIAHLKSGSVDTALFKVAGSLAPPPSPAAASASNAIPPRRSSLTRIADALMERDVFPGDVSPMRRDSVRALAAVVTAPQVADVAKRWLNPWQSTTGMLTRGAEHSPPRQQIPALSTPPAKRLRPDPVPARALRPLASIALPLGRRTLANGVVVRAARVAGRRAAVHVRVDYGDTASTISRGFPSDSTAAVLAQVAIRARQMLMERPTPEADSSSASRARARVLANILPVHAINASSMAWITVSVVGPRAPEALMKLAERQFAAFPPPPSKVGDMPAHRGRPPGPEDAPLEGDTSSMPGIAGEERIRDSTPQVAIVAGLAGVPRGHSDRRALELLNYIVGVPSYGGRLGWALTKSGLTYASAAGSSFGKSSGHILLSTTSDTRNADAVVQAIREVVEGIAADGVEEWELREAQAFMLGRATLYHARPSSVPELIAATLTDSELLGVDVLDPPAYSRAYLAVTLDEVNRVARTYYRPARLKIVAVGAVDEPRPSLFPRGTFRALFAR